jgi:hypothetical protein
MSYRYSAARIHEIVTAEKCLADGQTIEPRKFGVGGLKLLCDLELKDGPFLDLKLHGKAGRLTVPGSYEAALLLNAERVRGVGYAEVERKNFRTKLRIPAGWHQNICDPGAPTGSLEANRHVALPEFNPTDFSDFTAKVARMWNIDLGWEARLV